MGTRLYIVISKNIWTVYFLNINAYFIVIILYKLLLITFVAQEKYIY